MRFHNTLLHPDMAADGIAESPSMDRLPALLGGHDDFRGKNYEVLK